MKAKIFCILLLVILFLSAALPNITSKYNNKIKSLDEDRCYGFVAPIVKLENKSLENDFNCQIHHMINDFLREGIVIYWSAENFTVSILRVDNTIEENMFFEKGSFIIHFTENDTINTKICAIVFDYNQTSEIDENLLGIPIYQIIDDFEIQAYRLNKVKIARYTGSRNSQTQALCILASQNGFLDFDIVTPQDISEKLNINNFNVMFWPGGTPTKANYYYSIKSQFDEIFNNVMKNIRNFVNDGGGYFGACYGAFKASKLWLSSSKRIYLPTLRIANVVCLPPKNMSIGSRIVNQKIVDFDHPVTFGIENGVEDWYGGKGGGPKFVWLGKDVNIITLFENNSDFMDGSPGWVSTNYGKGKVVLFSSHPELMDFVGDYYTSKKIISNTLFYETCDNPAELTSQFSENLSFITYLYNRSLITINSEKQDLFNKLKEEINQSKSELNNFRANVQNLRQLILPKINQNKLIEAYSVLRQTSTDINYTIDYFNKLKKSLNILEKISNDSGLEQLINEFKENIYHKMNQSSILIKEGIDLIDNSENMLSNYRDRDGFINSFLEFRIFDTSFKIRDKSSIGLVCIVQAYHESLKFLRHNWYEYETNRFLNEFEKIET